MRCSRSAFGLLSIAGLVAASFLFTACSSGGGGDGGGDKYDNSKLSGAYTYVSLGNSGGIGVEAGTITFDGLGNGVYSATTQSASGSTTYTVTTDDTITIHNPVIGTSIVGTLRNDGSFFVGTDTRNGSETIIAAVKKSTQITDTTANYFSGRFSHNVQSSADIIQVDMADPVQGELTQTGLYPVSNPSTTSYTLLSDGTLSLPAIGPSRFGAVTSDQQLMILGDGESMDSPEILALCGFKLPGSGMTVASLTGSYLLYQFMDKNVGVGAFATNRGILTFNGAGVGTYFQTANSTGAIEPSRNITYTVDSDGTFVLDGVLRGVVIQDGSVLGLVDYDSADNSVGILVGVKY